MSTPTIQVVHHADLAPVPWRNGGGTTREVLAQPSADGTAFDWRISVADVAEDGPFSSFPGVDRVLLLCEGAGMELDVDGVTTLLRPFDALAFSGEARTSARLVDGPTRDLNVMTARDTTSAEVSLVEVNGSLDLQIEAGTTVLVVLEGRAVLDPTHEELGFLDAVRCEGEGAVRLVGDARVALIRLSAATAPA